MLYAKMIKKQICNTFFIYNLEIWNEGIKEKTSINLICVNEKEANSQVDNILKAIERAQGQPINYFGVFENQFCQS